MTEKNKALDAALAQIERAYGKGAVMRMGLGQAVEAVPVVSSGSIGLDLALGIGGFARGRVIEIYGPESARPPLPCTPLPKRRNSVEVVRSLTPSTRWTRSMPES